MPYKINTSTASLAPNKQTWEETEIGRLLTGETIYSAFKTVRLEFDSCAFSLYKQWSDAVSGASLGSFDVLNPDSTTFVTYTNVIAKIAKRPTADAGVAMGPWTVVLSDVKA